MPLLRKRKATIEDEVAENALRSRKQAKSAHTSSKAKSIATGPVPVILVSSHDANKENVDTRQKRKRDDEEVVVQQSCKRTRDVARRQRETTPQRSRFTKDVPPSPSETPGRKTTKLLDRLELQTRTPSSKTARAAYDTPPTSPDSIFMLADTLPSALTDLISIDSAYISALNEQTALDSSAFRIQLKDLLGSMTSIYNKKAVSVEDLRRVLALQSSDWQLEDFGRAGLGLVRDAMVKKMLSVLDTNKMKRAFETQLRRQWNNWHRVNGKQDCAAFIAQLPLAAITTSDTIEGSAAYRARGQDRLASLKASQVAAKQNQVNQEPVVSADASTSTRGSNLLDRVLAKQTLANSLPAGPTRLQLERKASVQRVEEIVRILDVLSAGRARASFSMQSVAQQIQQSVRNPMSRVEIDKCLTMIATEIMPQFVSIVSSGSVIGVVITRAGKLGFADLKKVIADIDV